MSEVPLLGSQGGSCGVVRFLMGEVPLYPADTIHRLLPRASRHFLKKEFFVDNLLVRIHSLIEMNLVDRPCAMGD